MDWRRRLLLLNFAVAFYNVGTIWLVQVTCYPLWAVVGRGEFAAYHEAWWHSIWGVILGPASLGLVGAVAMLWWRPPRVSRRAVWLGVGLTVAVLLLTVIWWAPLMARLAQAVDVSGAWTPDFRLLLSTHWLRVALVTAYGVLLFFMARASFALEDREMLTGTDGGRPARVAISAAS
jgi:hypothetical protein